MNESRRIKRKLMFFIDLNLRVKALMQEYKKRNTFGIKRNLYKSKIYWALMKISF